MPAIARNPALTQRLNGLETVRLIKQVPRDAGTISLPAQPRIDPRRDALAAKIAAQLSAHSDSGKPPAVKSLLPVRSLLDNIFNLPTLAVSFVATGLLIGSAFATMMLLDTVGGSRFEPSSPPERQAAATVLSASAADTPLPVATQPSAPPVHPVQTVALPAPVQSVPEDTDVSASEAASDGPGLFGDVSEVYRGDGESGVPYGAVYDAQDVDPKVAAIPDEQVQASVEEKPAAMAATQPRANDEAEAKWIELPIAVNLRASPSTRSAVIGVVEQGTRLQELERKRGWVKVTDPETSQTGWLYPNSIPKARRAAKPSAPQESENKPAAAGPFATLGNWLGKP